MYGTILDSIAKVTGIVKFDLHAEPEAGKTKIEVGGNVQGLFDLGPGRFGSEAIFVPREPGTSSGEDYGYLIFFVHDENIGKSSVNVIDEKTMSADPVAVMIPYVLPMQDSDPNVVDGVGAETGHVIRTTIGGRNGQSKQIPSFREASDSPMGAISNAKDGLIDWSQDFFGKPAFLTVSGQLNAETYATALSGMIEPELAFADDMACATAYLQESYGWYRDLRRYGSGLDNGNGLRQDLLEAGVHVFGRKQVAPGHNCMGIVSFD
ncbi:hypothetical protein REPUB_Repub03eG0175700 [Reevesia pubescens]